MDSKNTYSVVSDGGYTLDDISQNSEPFRRKLLTPRFGTGGKINLQWGPQ